MIPYSYLYELDFVSLRQLAIMDERLRTGNQSVWKMQRVREPFREGPIDGAPIIISAIRVREWMIRMSASAPSVESSSACSVGTLVLYM